jgi:heme/copper-type cytochrome/quinol oxidase subunit 2
MRRLVDSKYVQVGLILVLCGLGGFLLAAVHQAPPQDRTFTITAHKYAYDPPVLRVNRGDRIHVRLAAKDNTHGFYLEGYDVEAKMRPDNDTFWARQPSQGGDYKEVEEISFVASRTGKFRYRCSITCGYMHPFMQGELIVRPNYLYSTSVGLSVGMALGMLLLFRPSSRGSQS